MNNWESSKTENVLLKNLLSFSFHFFSLAALREMFRAKSGNYPEFSSGEVSRGIGFPQIDKENIAPEVESRNIEGLRIHLSSDPEKRFGTKLINKKSRKGRAQKKIICFLNG